MPHRWRQPIWSAAYCHSHYSLPRNLPRHTQGRLCLTCFPLLVKPSQNTRRTSRMHHRSEMVALHRVGCHPLCLFPEPHRDFSGCRTRGHRHRARRRRKQQHLPSGSPTNPVQRCWHPIPSDSCLGEPEPMVLSGKRRVWSKHRRPSSPCGMRPRAGAYTASSWRSVPNLRLCPEQLCCKSSRGSQKLWVLGDWASRLPELLDLQARC